MNNVQDYQNFFDGLQPWSGHVPAGYLVDFLGILTDANFRTMFGVDPTKTGGKHTITRLPTLVQDGEGWFEAVNWIAAAREARGRFVMVTLGACFGYQAVGSYRALQIINPVPCKLVAVEAEPDNVAWMRRFMRDNGIDPEAHWLVEAAIGACAILVHFAVPLVNYVYIAGYFARARRRPANSRGGNRHGRERNYNDYHGERRPHTANNYWQHCALAHCNRLEQH
jgi:hypothetical protein